jgi:hypothetical protein
MANLLKRKLESHPQQKGNLEGSVRSRGTDGRVGLERDLIEAGLSEPRMAGSGYGDCVAAPIPHGGFTRWVDGGETMVR